MKNKKSKLYILLVGFAVGVAALSATMLVMFLNGGLQELRAAGQGTGSADVNARYWNGADWDDNINLSGTTTLQNVVWTSSDHPTPSGVITMWSGSTSSIPTGWTLCDGTDGTPNLSNRFIRGTTGSPGATGGNDTTNLSESQLLSHDHGSGTLDTDSNGYHDHSDGSLSTDSNGYHDHSDGSLSTGSAGDHNHGNGDLSTGSAGSHNHGGIKDRYHDTACVDNQYGTTDQINHGVCTEWRTTNNNGSHSHSVTNGATGYAGSHSHGVDGSTDGAGSHSHGVDGTTGNAGSHAHNVNSGTTGSAGSGNSIENRPAYYELAFIMKE